MRQNVYDNPEFFAGYMQLRDNAQGLNEAVVWPSLDRLLPDLSGKRVLDLGCGEGGLCRYAADAGAASVVGVDPSSLMLELARERTSDQRVTYRQGFLEDIDIPLGSADVIISILTLHYVADLEGVLQRATRWLASGGVFVAVVEHPIVTSQRPKSGWTSEAGRHVAWPVSQYFDEGKRTEHWFVDGVVKYHRSISTILTAVRAAGFAIDAVDEPHPTEDALTRRPQHRDELIRPSVFSWRALKQEHGDRGLPAGEARSASLPLGVFGTPAPTYTGDGIDQACNAARSASSTKEERMGDSVYRVTEVIGTSGESWEAAAANAVATAAGSVRDLRVAEVIRQDVTIENGAISSYRVRLGLSFKYETGD